MTKRNILHKGSVLYNKELGSKYLIADTTSTFDIDLKGEVVLYGVQIFNGTIITWYTEDEALERFRPEI